MKNVHKAFEEHIRSLLEAPDHQQHPLREALERLWQQHNHLLQRIERITHVSDAYQSMAREREQSINERFEKQIRQLSKVARISDRYQQMMFDLNVALEEASTHDALTGLANRRLLTRQMRSEVERAERHGKPFSLLMLDVDFFKQVNDEYGHEVGDRVLVELAHTLKESVRDYDLCGRWGGEEFLILFPETPLEDARDVYARVHDNIRLSQVRSGIEVISITVSAGAAQWRSGESYSDVLKRADAALLSAKRAGRNRLALEHGHE